MTQEEFQQLEQDQARCERFTREVEQVVAERAAAIETMERERWQLDREGPLLRRADAVTRADYERRCNAWQARRDALLKHWADVAAQVQREAAAAADRARRCGVAVPS